MIILKDTTDKIIVDLAGVVTANQLECMASYREIDTSTYTADRNLVLTNNTTAVDLVDSPAANKQRVIDYISVYNKDTANATVDIIYNANGSLFLIFKTTLAPNEKIEYQEGQGFRVISNAGSIKNSINQGNNPSNSTMNVVVLGVDRTNNNAVANTMQDVTGLSFPVTSGKKYYFRFLVQYTAAATTTGSRWSINGPGGTMRYRSEYSLTATTQTINEGIIAHDLPAASNASSAATGGNIALVEGYYEASVTGNVILRVASEVASSAIVAKAGSICQYMEVL